MEEKRRQGERRERPTVGVDHVVNVLELDVARLLSANSAASVVDEADVSLRVTRRAWIVVSPRFSYFLPCSYAVTLCLRLRLTPCRVLFLPSSYTPSPPPPHRPARPTPEVAHSHIEALRPRFLKRRHKRINSRAVIDVKRAHDNLRRVAHLPGRGSTLRRDFVERVLAPSEEDEVDAGASEEERCSSANSA